MHIKFVDNIAAEGTVYLPSKCRIISSMYKKFSKSSPKHAKLNVNKYCLSQATRDVYFKVQIISHTTENYAMLHSRGALESEFCKMEPYICGSSVWNRLLDS
jgi:predicted ATP-grasp superfamily ATP-dependent carboligase